MNSFGNFPMYYFYVGIFIVAVIVFLITRRGAAQTIYSAYFPLIQSIASGYTKEPSLAIDLGHVVESNVAKEVVQYAITHSSTGAYKFYTYFIVAVGGKTVVFIPCKMKMNLFSGLKPVVDKNKQVETYPRENVAMKTGVAKTNLYGSNAVLVEFSLPNGTKRNIEFFVQPQGWSKAI